MKARGTKLALQVALVLIFLGSTMPLHAQYNPDATRGSILYICNHGTVPVEVVAAIRNWDVARGFGKYYWEITSAIAAPQQCRKVENDDGTPSYIAFGFTDSKGEWGSGSIAQVPDLGSIQRTILGNSEKVLTGATKAMCARKDANYYAMDDDFTTDCSTLKLTEGGQYHGHDRGHGSLFPLTSALYFHPDTHDCGYKTGYDGLPYGPYVCDWTYYYLNIYPSATDWEMHAAAGTKSGADAAAEPSGDSGESGAQILAKLAKAVIDAADSQSKARAQAKLDAEEAQLKHAREQQAAREERDKKILAADAAGDPNAKYPAQMVRREQEDNRLRWATTPQSPAAYDPKWKGQNVAIVGTVSRVEVDPNGYPKWMTIYFKESPDATFVVCSPYPDMFQERVGLDLSVLVGKTLEAAGQVESPSCGGNAPKGSIRVVESTQWKIH